MCNVTYFSQCAALFLNVLSIYNPSLCAPCRGHHKLSDVQKCLEQAAASDARVYNFSVITEERKWVQVREREEGEREKGAPGKGWWDE